MRRISSRTTFFNKRAVPIIWFGAIFVMTVFASWQGLRAGRLPLRELVAPLLLAGIGYLIFLRAIFGVVDEIWEDAETLIIKNGTKEDRIPLSDVMNVNYTVWPNPERVTLLLRRPSMFGREVSFHPPARIKFFSRSPVVDDLIERIEVSRTRQVG